MTAKSLELGGGWSHGFSDTLDFVGTLSYVDAELRCRRSTTGSRSAAAFAAVSASRSSSMPRLKFVDFDESGSDTGVSVGGRYYFNDSMALGASLDFYDNADTLRLGFRWEF